MTIHIAGFWLGVLTTIFVEVLLCIVFVLYVSKNSPDG